MRSAMARLEARGSAIGPVATVDDPLSSDSPVRCPDKIADDHVAILRLQLAPRLLLQALSFGGETDQR